MANYLLLLILLLIILAIVSSSQIAIDFGSEYYKVSIIKGKSFEMVENSSSKTKTPTVMFFTDNQRLFEAEALSKKVKYPKDTFTYMTNFIGEPYSSPFLKDYLDMYYIDYNIEKNNQTTSTQFAIHYHNKIIKLPIEGIIAMLFRHIQSMAKKYSNNDINDWLLTIPSFFNYKQRLALSQAAKIANLTLFGFVSDNIAAAVHYSLKQSFDKNSYYIYYNMGASYTQVLLVCYKKSTMNTQEIQVLNEAYDKSLGGNRFTRNLIVEIIDRFNKKNNLNINKGKAYNKILPQAKKYQEILSANKEAQISIMNIDQGLNFNDHITRKEFEAINQDTFKLIYKPIDKVLRSSNMNITQISQIELIGGGIRVPFVQKILQKRLGNYSSIIGTHLNGDDSMALGAGYILSNITKTLKSRRETVLTGNGPSSTLSAMIINQNTSEEEYCFNHNNSNETPSPEPNALLNDSCVHLINKTEIIVPLRSGYGQRKVIKYKHDTDLLIDIIETIEQGKTILPIIQFNITGLNTEINYIKSLTHSDLVPIPYIYLSFVFDYLGELTLSSYSSFDVTYYYTNITEITLNTSSSQVIQYDYVPYHINELSKEEKDNITKTLNRSIEFNISESDVMQLKNQLKVGSTRKQRLKRKLIVTSRDYSLKGLDDITIANLTNKLNAIDQYEDNKSLIIEQKNKLETLIYTKRALMDSKDSKQFGTIDEYNTAQDIINEINQWFEEEGEDASYDELELKILDLMNAFEEFDRRIQVNNDRNIAIEKFEVNIKKIVNKAKKMISEYPWIREYYEVNFTSYLNTMERLLEENVKMQNERLLYEVN